MTRQSLKEVQEKKKELIKEEKKLKKELEENKVERAQAKTNIADNKKLFEATRKELVSKFSKLNDIHAKKSAFVHLKDFERIALEFLEEVGKVEETLDKYLISLKEGKEVI